MRNPFRWLANRLNPSPPAPPTPAPEWEVRAALREMWFGPPPPLPKGRATAAARRMHARDRIKPSDVLALRAKGYSMTAIARFYDVSRRTLYYIMK